MSLVTVEVARFGHAKKRTKVKLRQGMPWKDFLEQLCSKLGMAGNTPLEVTDHRGHTITSTKDVRDKTLLIAREGSHTQGGRNANEEPPPKVRQLPQRAHSFGGHDVGVYASVGHSSMSPIMHSRPLPMSPMVPEQSLPRAPSRNSLYSMPAMSPPPSPRERVSTLPQYGSSVLPRRKTSSVPTPTSPLIGGYPNGLTMSPRKQRPPPGQPPQLGRMVSAPHYGSAFLSPMMARSHQPPPQQQPQLRRFHSQTQVGGAASIINPLICSLSLLKRTAKEADSFVATAHSKEAEQDAKFYRVKVAFIRTDVQGFRHPYENEVLILQHLRGASSNKSTSYIIQSAGSTYCKTQEHLALLHSSLRKEIAKHLKHLMDCTPGIVFITAYPLGLETLLDKSKTRLEPAEALTYGVEMLKCFLFLQQHGVIHRCPLLSKFQISADRRVRLSEFENSVIINSKTLLFHYRNVGPFGTNLSRMSTLAPDVLNTHARHEVAPGYPDDSVNYSGQYPWSFGVLFSLLASGQHPLPDYPLPYGPPGQINYWPDQVKVAMPEEIPIEVREGIKQCLSANPNHRCSLQQLLHIFAEAQKDCSSQKDLLRSSSTKLSSSSSSDLRGTTSGKEDHYSHPTKRTKRRNRRWQTQPVGVQVSDIMKVEGDRVMDPFSSMPHRPDLVAPYVVHQSTAQPAASRQPVPLVPVPVLLDQQSLVSTGEGTPILPPTDDTITSATVCIPSEVDSTEQVMAHSQLSTSMDDPSSSVAEAQVISIDIPDSEEECLLESMGASSDCEVVEITEVPPPIEEPHVVAIPVVATPDSVKSFPSFPPTSAEGPPAYSTIDRHTTCTTAPVHSQPQPLGVPFSQPLPRKLDFPAPSHYLSRERMAQRTGKASETPSQNGIENRTIYPCASETSVQPSHRIHTQRNSPHAKSQSTDQLESNRPDRASETAGKVPSNPSPAPVQHGVISNAHSSSSRSSYEEGHVVPIEYFPGCFSQGDDKVFTDTHSSKEKKTTSLFLQTSHLSTDVQRSHSLNRGKKGEPDAQLFGRVPARGPQTRSVYDLREENAAVISTEAFQKEAIKACGHTCLIEREHVCCLCKKNASWTFSGEGTDGAAFWTKGCYVCRRRVSEINQLSTVSRPRAELSASPTNTEGSGHVMINGSTSPKQVKTSPTTKSKNASSASSGGAKRSRERSCCIM